MISNLSINSKIKKIRQDKGLSQEDVASKLDISRLTYIQMEKGEREPTVPELSKLAMVFGVSIEYFLYDEPEMSLQIEMKQDRPRKTGEYMRIILDRPKADKFKEIFLYILEKVGAKQNVGQSVINKLLYFIDFDFYEKYEEQIIGATYIRNHFGPTPTELVKIIGEMEKNKEIEKVNSIYFKRDQTKYLPTKRPDLSRLSAREIKHIDEVLERLSDMNATDICNYSHEDIPWKVHKPGEIISYESVFYRDDKYSVRTYGDQL